MTNRKTASRRPSTALDRNPLDYADVLLIRWPWVVVPLILITTVAGVATQFVPKEYRSRTVIMVESEEAPEKLLPRGAAESSTDQFLEVQQEVLARPRVERVLDELDPYPELAGATRASLVDRIRSRTSVRLQDTDAFVIEYTDTDPKRAQQIANRLASLFVEEATGANERQAQGANEFIERQLEETRQQLKRHEESLSTFKQQYMGMLPEQLGANLSTLQRLQLEVQSIEEAIRTSKDRKTLLERQLATEIEMNDPEAQLLPLDGISDQPSSSQLSLLKAQLTALRDRYTEEHPEVKAVKARIEKLEAMAASGEGGDDLAASSESLLIAEIRAQIQGVEADIVNLEERARAGKGEIQRYQLRVEAIPKVEEQLQSLERDYGLVSSYYSQLLSKKLEAETASAVEKRWKGAQFRILDPAYLPETPVYPSLSIFLGLGGLIGLGTGVGLAFAVEFLDHSIKDTEELRALLPYPLLISIPHIPKPKQGAASRAGRGRWRKPGPSHKRGSQTRVQAFKERESA
ncbi:MAG TPA: XrtA system polysaccharide chain length determinant [Candidatus Methylomirabilis sp.]|nr:XrtA system polysaccharide chain length determinant [Candidatus Methylomirabilis sp.]